MDKGYTELMSELVECQQKLTRYEERTRKGKENIIRYEERVKEIKKELAEIEAIREYAVEELKDIVRQLKPKSLYEVEDE